MNDLYDAPPMTVTVPGGASVVVDRHVSLTEANEALDPLVGDGAPDAAPDVLPPAAGTGEPVAIAGATGVVAVVGTLLAYGVPVTLACALAAFLGLLSALARSRVRPAR